MGELRNLRVERVDGVDKPATQREWVILKSEADEANEGENAREVIVAALTALAKEEKLYEAETAEALTALAELVEVEVDFGVIVEETEKAECEGCEETCEECKSTEEEVVEASEEATPEPSLAELIAEALKSELPTALEAMLSKETAEQEPKKLTGSKQIEDEGLSPTVVKAERPSFANVIFGQE